MFNCIKNSFHSTHKYIILATPLILFSLISTLYLLFSTNGNIINITISGILYMLMCAAFIAGWGYLIKSALQKNDNDEIFYIIKDFPAGVGEYFLSILGAFFNIIILTGIMMVITYTIGIKVIGNPGISATAIYNSLESQMAMQAFLTSLNETQLVKFSAWNLLLFGTITVEYFLIMFYFPAIFYKSKNPFKAFFLSLKDIFSRYFWGNIALFIGISASYILISLLRSMLNFNIVMFFLITILTFYYLVYIVFLLFSFYYDNYIKVGKNIDKRI